MAATRRGAGRSPQSPTEVRRDANANLSHQTTSSSARTTDVKEQATNESNEYTSTQRAKAQYVQVAPAMRSTKVSLVAACTRPHIAGDFYTDNQFVSLVTETPATSVYACSLFRITGSVI